MTALDQLLDIVPLATTKPPATQESNVTLLPDGSAAGLALAAGPQPGALPATANVAQLKHAEAAPAGDASLPPRVVAVLGPGATFNGLAGILLEFYTRAGGISPPLTRGELARGLLHYNRNILTADNREHHKVGLCLPLPIEIDTGTGAWTVDPAAIRKGAGRTEFKTAWSALLAKAPDRLPVLEPVRIEGDAAAVLSTGTPASRAAGLWQRVVRNPSEVVLTLFTVFRKLNDAADQSFALALAMVDAAAAHQAALLAATRAGNGILRRLETLLAGAGPAGTNAAKLAAAKALLDNALRQGPPGARTLVPHREVPATVDILAARGGSAKAELGATADPPGGVHLIVLGRDVAVGRTEAARVKSVTVTGPAFAGRIPLDPFLADDATGLNPGNDFKVAGKLALLALDGPGQGAAALDAVKARDEGLLSVGLRSWSALDPAGLGALLFEFKSTTPDEFDLYFKLHGLDVDQAGPNNYRLLKLGPDGKSPTPMTADPLRAFFGTVDAKGNVRFTEDWAARFRLPALVSRRYRRAQVTLAIAQKPADPVEVAIASVGPVPAKPYALPLAGHESSDLLTKVTAKLNPFLAAQHTAHVKSADTLGFAVVDLTGGAMPAYAGLHDEETFYIGSMGKAAAMYAALELRMRLRRAAARAGADLHRTTAGWHVPFLAKVRRIWGPKIGKGFPGFRSDMPAMFPKVEDMFTFPVGAATDIDFQKGGIPIVDIVDRNLNRPLPTWKFDEMIWSMMVMSNQFAADSVITTVGFPYLNTVLREAGFFDPSAKPKTGIWVSASYDNHDWKPGVDPITLSGRGKLHYKATTNLVGNARQFATMLALADRKLLFEGDADSCKAMHDYMDKVGITGADSSPVRTAVRATPDGFGGRPAGTPALKVDEAYSKIGLGDPPVPPAVPSQRVMGAHDCAIIQRKHAGKDMRYVLVVVGGYDQPPDSTAFFTGVQIVDGVLADKHP